MHQMLKSSSRSFALVSLAAISQSKINLSSKGHALSMAQFDTKGFPEYQTIQPMKNGLYLTAVGMRRKKILFVDVDIYLVALSLSKAYTEKAKKWTFDESNLADVLFAGDESKTTDDTNIAINLKFVRSVTTSQIVEAFNDSFRDCNPISVQTFKGALNSALGANGMKQGEEVIFVWHNGGGLSIVVNGVTKEFISEGEVEKRLLEVYVDPKRTVSPELVKCLRDNICV